MIPRIIHTIWLSDTPPPFEADTWRSRNHDWKYKLWKLEDLKKVGLGVIAEQCITQKVRNEQLHEILKISLLKLIGGVIVDPTFPCNYPLDKKWLDHDFVYGKHLIGASKDSPVLDDCLRQIRRNRGLKIENVAKGFKIPDEVFTKLGLDTRVVTNRKHPRLNIYETEYLNTDKPIISVIVTVHNQKHFVDEGIGGFCDQDIKVPYEILAICDSCVDGSADYIREKYPYVKVYEVDYKHPCTSRNHGIDNVKGDYICFFDGDDIPHYDYLSKLYKALQDNPTKNISYSRFDAPGYGLEHKKLPPCNFLEWSNDWLDYGPITNTPIMIKRELIDRGARWDDNIRTREDYEFGLTLRKAGADGVHVREVLWDYRFHAASIWGSNNATALANHSLNYIQKKHGIAVDDLECTFVSLISRLDVLDDFFQNIAEIDMPRDKMHYFVYIDSVDENLIEESKKRALELKFRTTRFFVTNKENVVSSVSFIGRGMHIARHIETIVNEVNRHVGSTPFIFMTEDDTKVPSDSYQKLMKHMKENDNLAFVTGIEASRQQNRHLGIAYLTPDEKGEIIHRINPLPKKEGLEKINSAGWYCWIGRIKQIVDLPYRCSDETKDDRYIGPDAYFVFDLDRKGYDCMVDWSIWCEHWDFKKNYWIKPDEVIYMEWDFYQTETGHWKRTWLSPIPQ